MIRHALRGFAAVLVAGAVALWAAPESQAQGVPFGISPTHQASKQAAAADPQASAEVWYDASTFLTDGSTKDGSAFVTKWANKGTGGSTYDLTVVTGTPLYTASAVNSLGAIDFEAGDTDGLAVNATPFTAAPMHWFVVVKSEVLSGTRIAAYVGDKDQDNIHAWRLGVTFSSFNRGQWTASDAGNTNVLHGDTLSDATVYLLEGRETSSTDRGVNVDDGTEVTSSTSRTPSGADRIGIGCRYDATPDLPWDGMICEVVGYGSIKTGAARDAIIAALDAKWAIPGIP